MRAVVAQVAGEPEVLQVADLPTPQPGPGELLVKVDACGVCHHDLLHRSGRLPGSHFPAVLGHEVAGVIAGNGAGTAKTAPEGSRVVVYPRYFCGQCAGCIRGRQDLCTSSTFIGTTRDGGYGEFLAVPMRNVVPLTGDLDARHAALAACPIGTSIRALEGRAKVQLGESVLIVGAGGGLGLHQIQIAKLMGAIVLAVSTSEAKVATLREAGADEVFVSDAGQFSSQVWDWSGRRGVDVIVDNVVTGTFGESIRTARMGGRLVALGNVDVAKVDLNPGLLIARRISVLGCGNCTLAEMRQAVALLESGAIQARVGGVLPFDDAARGHREVESRSVVGRMVLSGWRDS